MLSLAMHAQCSVLGTRKVLVSAAVGGQKDGQFAPRHRGNTRQTRRTVWRMARLTTSDVQVRDGACAKSYVCVRRQERALVCTASWRGGPIARRHLYRDVRAQPPLPAATMTIKLRASMDGSTAGDKAHASTGLAGCRGSFRRSSARNLAAASPPESARQDVSGLRRHLAVLACLKPRPCPHGQVQVEQKPISPMKAQGKAKDRSRHVN